MHEESEIQIVCWHAVFPQRALNDIEDAPNEYPLSKLRPLPVVGIGVLKL